MMRMISFISLVFLAVCLVDASKVTPVQKVIQLLSDMQAKGQQEADAEKETHSKYQKWVTNEKRELSYEIKRGEAAVSKFAAKHEKNDASATSLQTEVDTLSGTISEVSSSIANANSQRKTFHDDFLASQTDLQESVDALGRAIDVLKSQNYDRKQALMLLQRKNMAKVLSMLQQTPFGQPEVMGYESQSSGIIDLLKKLEDKFEKELHDVEREEANSKHAHNMLLMNLNDQLEGAEEDKTQKEGQRGEAARLAAEAKGQHASALADLNADKQYLAEVVTTWEQKNTIFEANQKLRGEELVAIGQAVEILSGNAVSGSAEKHLPSLVQTTTSFLQVLKNRRALSSTKIARERVVSLLENAASVRHSAILTVAALNAAKDPFAKVVGMIKNLIARLEAEAAQEAEHKDTCDKNLAENKADRQKLTKNVNSLTAVFDRLGAEIGQLEEEIAKLSAEEATLAKSIREQTTNRQEEKAENTATIKDAKEAQNALTQAIGVLKEFYSKAGGASLIEQVPEMTEYRGMQDAKGGVLGLLEVINSDFARLEADTTAEEAQAQNEFEKSVAAATAAKKDKHESAHSKKLLKDRKEHEQHGVKKNLDSNQTELSAALEVHDALKAQCVVVKVSYEERVAQREAEIESLQQAYEILDSGVAGA